MKRDEMAPRAEPDVVVRDVVRADWRGLGIATRMIERLLLGRSGRTYAVTRHTMVAHFERWGFVPIETRQAPPAVRQRRLPGRCSAG
jgi:N-acetylglutamate synthase-like GNAT family acetyltransferase